VSEEGRAGRDTAVQMLVQELTSRSVGNQGRARQSNLLFNRIEQGRQLVSILVPKSEGLLDLTKSHATEIADLPLEHIAIGNTHHDFIRSSQHSLKPTHVLYEIPLQDRV
jgi:hypothetical protein